MQREIGHDSGDKRRQEQKLQLHELRRMAVFERLTGVFPDREHAPKCKLVLLLEIFRQRVWMRVVDHGVGYELHLPASRGHAIGKFDVFRTGNRERSVVSPYLEEALTAKRRRVGIDEIDILVD